MMATELLADLIKQKVELWGDGQHLRVRAPKGVLTPELQAKLIASKGDLLDLLRGQSDAASANPIPQITPDTAHRYEPFPLTDMQQAYWVGRSGAFEFGNVACHAYYEVEAKELDLARFNLALQQLIERHDMLRAIVLADGRQQILNQVPPYEIETLDLRGYDAQTANAFLDSIRHRLSHQVLPSDRWPLFEIRASQLDDQCWRLHFSFDILIVDVWSLQILFHEWAELYNHPTTKLPAVELSFRDYVLGEAQLRQSELYSAAQQYWTNRLPDLPPAPELPLAANYTTLKNPRFKRRSGRLDPKPWRQIKRLAVESGVTPSGILLAAFAEILALWSKSNRFTINVTLHNRFPLHPQVNEIVGDFTTLIPLAVDHSASSSFQTRAAAIQAQLLEDMEHRYVSGVQILRDIGRVQGKAPGTTMPIVFTSLLSQHLKTSVAEQTLWMGEVVYGISQTPQVWLDHQVLEENGALVFNWDAVEGIFPENLLQDLFDSYCALLQRLGEEPSIWRESVINLLPAAQLQQRQEVNETKVALLPTLLHTQFQQQADQRPSQAAVIAANGTLTYEELAHLANHLGHQLRQMGACPNTLVAVVMEKGWEQVAATLGILQAGAAYLPIDPNLPKERLWHLLGHAEISIVLTQSWINERLEWPDGIARLSVDSQRLGTLHSAPIESVQQPDDLAYVIYTSGSTGLPKGVMIPHSGAVNTIDDINRRFDVRPGDKVLALSNLGFDLSVYDIFGTLSAGGTIVMPADSATRNPECWADLIQRQAITIWNSVPALMDMLVTYADQRLETQLASLRLVMLSGDWIPVTLPERIKKLAPQAEIISLGGATEASIWSILYAIDRDCADFPSIPYGRPMANQGFHVLNEALEPRPIWVAGNLYISGKGLAVGYWRDEKQTKASFLIHPRSGERLYKTGDLGRYLPDGNIEFLGREDSQVKVQGYRIELGEIEAALGKHPAICANAVLPEGQRERKRLVAYVATHPDKMVTADELRQYLKERLPAYMVPSAFFTLDSLPLNANGKLDRKQLPQLAKSTAGQLTDRRQAEEFLEAKIAALIAEVLQLESIAPDQDIVELGGNSVDLIRIAALIEKEFQLRPGIEKFYAHPTPRGLANALRELESQACRVDDLDTMRGYRKAAHSRGCEEGEL
ncbi:MAG: amino acid adenylation domain-containing protein [Acidobacteria bacterium]|nr:amino acid adenylation domain-containing protein [Acidobacteriota bacterium]